MRTQPTDAEARLWSRLRDRRLEGFKFVRQYASAARDVRRTRFLNSQGFSVLRFWNNEVLSSTDGVMQALLLTLRDCPSPDWRFAPATLSPEGRGDAVAPPEHNLKD
ncbi:MAG: DUF559 domain-containing protein [Devosia sp.]|nr:DUF559 domain-containing protein [Devosia sp.]